MAKRRREACPCGGGADYAGCCRRLHRREAVAARPSELVRARFAAFARGEGAFLLETTHPDHPLHARPAEEAIRELSTAKNRLRYRALDVREERVEGDRGSVLFGVRVFERGRDRSFVELSRFARLDGAWRYLDGLTVGIGEPAGRARGIDAFLESIGP